MRVQHIKDMESEFVAGEGCHVQGTLQLQRITGAPCMPALDVARLLLKPHDASVRHWCSYNSAVGVLRQPYICSCYTHSDASR